MMENKEYDKITLYVKKDKIDDVINNYKIFGWKVEQQTENKTYEDIIDLSMSRPHFIDNKDELQLQQVYMEEKLNALGRLEKFKYSGATIFGLIFGPLSLSIVVLAIYLFIAQYFYQGIAVACLGLITVTLFIIFLPKMINKNKLNYDQKTLELNIEIEEILRFVSDLVVKDERN